MARRYGPGGVRLWNGKTAEQFSPEDTRQFLADTEALLHGKENSNMAKNIGAEPENMQVAAALEAAPLHMEVTARPIEPKGNLLGFASVKVGPITIDDFKIVASKDGELFVGAPSKPDKSSKTGYRPTVWIDKDSKNAFNEQVLGAYHDAVEQAQSKASNLRSAPDNPGIEAQMAAAQKQADRANAARPAPAKAGNEKTER